MKIDSDKTTVSIKDNQMLSTGNAYDAVKKMPGVIASPTGGLTLNGKGVTVFIDNAPTTLSGTDLQNYLSSLPASAIEKAELIYNPGAAYDANASGSIINLVTSNKRLKGVNASFNINYNFNKYQKPSPQLLLNGKEKNLSWQTMVGYNYIEGEEISGNNQTFTSFTPDEVLLQKRIDINTNRNFYARFGTNYRLSKKSNLLLNYNLNVGNDRNDFDSKTIGSGITYFNKGLTKIKNNNHEVSLQYKTKLDTLGRNLDVTAFANTFNRNPINNSNTTDIFLTDNITTNIDLKLVNYYLKYDFTFPFDKLKFSINTGGKYNTIQVNNLGKYNLGANASTIDFDYIEHNLVFYIEARKKYKKFNFTVGIRYEDFNIDREANSFSINPLSTPPSSSSKDAIKYKNKNIFPNISALYELGKQVNVTASYSRKINQPNYNVLDPNSNGGFDRFNSSQGNPFLNPTFFDNYEFKISALDYIQIGTNYTVANDNNLFLFDAKPGELVSNQTFQQFDKFKTFSAFANFPIPLDYFFKGKEEFQKRMSTIDKMNYIYLSINYIKSLTTGYNFSFENKPIWNFATETQINLPWDVKNNITYYILPKGNWEIYQVTKPIQQLDISFNKSFLNKKLKVGLYAFDLLNSNQINALISSTNLETTFYKKQDTRVFRISLTYNFGNLKLDKENTNIDIEKVKQGGGMMK